MKWEILILTQTSRKVYFERLMDVLRPQLYGRDVEVVVGQYDKGLSFGENHKMLDSASAEYVNFLDDDDLVPENYVEKILPLLDGVDFIGYNVELYSDGVLQPKRAYHSLRFSGWYENEHGYYRGLSYMNPIRRELALKVPISGPYGDDARWAKELQGKGLVATEHYIDQAMYFYFYRSVKDDGLVTA